MTTDTIDSTVSTMMFAWISWSTCF